MVIVFTACAINSTCTVSFRTVTEVPNRARRRWN